MRACGAVPRRGGARRQGASNDLTAPVPRGSDTFGLMGLVACPDCNRAVSDIAPLCPGCGRPMHIAAPQTQQVVPHAPPAPPVHPSRGSQQDPTEPIRHPATGRKLGCFLGGFLVVNGVLGALQCLAGLLGALGYNNEVTGRPLSGWAFWIGGANLGGALAASKWDRSGAGLMVAGWAGAIVLGLVDGPVETIVAAVPFLIVSAIVLGAAPWTLRCARCHVQIVATTLQCRNCGQQYWPADVAGAFPAARPAGAPVLVMPPVGQRVWVQGSGGDWQPAVVVEQGAGGQVCVQVPEGASVRYAWLDTHQLRPRDG
jgi:RNA polymerase subunit RPABC4/transcription elongation factor Spt4